MLCSGQFIDLPTEIQTEFQKCAFSLNGSISSFQFGTFDLWLILLTLVIFLTADFSMVVRISYITLSTATLWLGSLQYKFWHIRWSGIEMFSSAVITLFEKSYFCSSDALLRDGNNLFRDISWLFCDSMVFQSILAVYWKVIWYVFQKMNHSSIHNIASKLVIPEKVINDRSMSNSISFRSASQQEAYIYFRCASQQETFFSRPAFVINSSTILRNREFLQKICIDITRPYNLIERIFIDNANNIWEKEEHHLLSLER